MKGSFKKNLTAFLKIITVICIYLILLLNWMTTLSFLVKRIDV